MTQPSAWGDSSTAPALDVPPPPAVASARPAAQPAFDVLPAEHRFAVWRARRARIGLGFLALVALAIAAITVVTVIARFQISAAADRATAEATELQTQTQQLDGAVRMERDLAVYRDLIAAIEATDDLTVNSITTNTYRGVSSVTRNSVLTSFTVDASGMPCSQFIPSQGAALVCVSVSLEGPVSPTQLTEMERAVRAEEPRTTGMYLTKLDESGAVILFAVDPADIQPGSGTGSDVPDGNDSSTAADDSAATGEGAAPSGA